MTKNMMLYEVKLPNKKSVYEITKEKHSHILCNYCKEVTDIHTNTNKMIDEISNKYDFTIDQTDIVFSGTCKKCKDFRRLEN